MCDENVILEPTWAKLLELPQPNSATFTFTITQYNPDDLKAFYNYLHEVYTWTSNPIGQIKPCNVVLHQTEGDLIKDSWVLIECWPTSINFGELSHDMTELPQVEITWRVGKVNLQNKAPFKKGSVEIIEEF